MKTLWRKNQENSSDRISHAWAPLTEMLETQAGSTSFHGANQAASSEIQKAGSFSWNRRRRQLGPKPDVADDVGHPVVEAADPVQGEDGPDLHGPAPLLVVVVLHLDVDGDM